jgi:phosphatidylserine/phosphatidylglycerophosphate/cardiolipin synthase-like enzyme
MTAMLHRARTSVAMEFFLFGGSHADRMMDILAQRKAQHGVDVKITLDRTLGLLPFVRRECRAALKRLRALGLDVVLSDARPFPDTPNRPALAHNKILVVDDREALVGGMNIGSLFRHHHDVMIQLTGPTAAVLRRQVLHDRQFALDPALTRPAGSPPLSPPPEGLAADPTTDTSAVRIVGTGVGRRTTREAVVQNLRRARTSLCIAMCEMGATDVLDEVIAAHRRGLDVRVLLDPLLPREYLPRALGPLRRLPPGGVMNAGAVRKLTEAGVRVHLYRPADDFWLLHMKLALFDDRSAIVGSTNWTRGGFEWVGETDVELHGGPVIGQLRAQFEADWQHRSAPARRPSAAIHWLGRAYERWVQ